MVVAPDDDLIWIAERAGRVLRVDLKKGETAETVLDISNETTTESERGLLGIAITQDWLYANFTDTEGNTRIDAFKRQGTTISSERRTILTWQQPYSNHNGGALVLDDIGNLYIGSGDGGYIGDPHDNGQNPHTLLGAILRVKPTPDSDKPYAIPNDNPYPTGETGAPEVFIIGLRNPWRFSFDRTTGDLWIADVGQDLYEEVTLLRASDNWAGANLGWNLREGTHPYPPQSNSDNPPDTQTTANLIDPDWEYGRGHGCSVTGGVVYRGTAIDSLHGSYIFGDYCTSKLWSLNISTDNKVTFTDLDIEIPGGRLVSFGQDTDNELYTLSLNGDISRIKPA